MGFKELLTQQHLSEQNSLEPPFKSCKADPRFHEVRRKGVPRGETGDGERSRTERPVPVRHRGMQSSPAAADHIYIRRYSVFRNTLRIFVYISYFISIFHVYFENIFFYLVINNIVVRNFDVVKEFVKFILPLLILIFAYYHMRTDTSAPSCRYQSTQQEHFI